MFTKDQGADPGPVDGRWGWRTSRALQKALNNIRSSAPKTAEEMPTVEQAIATTDETTPTGVPLLESSVKAAFQGMPAQGVRVVLGASAA